MTIPLEGRWVRIKAIFYNRGDGTVRLEQWIDGGPNNTLIPSNNWHKTLDLQTQEHGKQPKITVAETSIQS